MIGVTNLLTRKRLPAGLAIASQSADFWRGMAPALTISDHQPGPFSVPGSDQLLQHRLRLMNAGYAHLPGAAETGKLSSLTDAMTEIAAAGLPPAFLGVYDECWDVVARLSPLIEGVLGGAARLLPDFWAGHGHACPPIAAGRAMAGRGVFRNRAPKTITVWVALTDATPDNGCLYLVPADQDKEYGRREPGQAKAPLPAIRAVPTRAGDVVIMTGDTYRWQGQAETSKGQPPVMYLSWSFCEASAGFGVTIDSFPYVPFETRLSILGGQMRAHADELGPQPVWRAVQQALVNRFPIRAMDA